MDKIKHIEESISKDSKLPEWILNMEGMSGKNTRHLYNNICSIVDINYLEVGCWKGSSTCSALWGNKINATVIDNWSEFGNVEKEFMANIEKVKGSNDFKFIFGECNEVDLKKLPKIDVYLYDGGHSLKQQEEGLTYYYPVLNDEFIFMVDDYDWIEPREGTKNAIKKLGLKVLYEKHITGEGWHNGTGIFLLKKS